MTVKTTGYNPEWKVVITFKRTIMVYKRGLRAAYPAPGRERAMSTARFQKEGYITPEQAARDYGVVSD